MLRRVKLAASKLGLGEAVQWADAELAGYQPQDKIPDYRTIIGRVMVHSRFMGVYPLGGNAKLIDELSKVTLRQAISALEELAANGKDGLMVPVSREIVNLIDDENGGGNDADLNKHITQAAVIGIIDQVRNAVLDWAVALGSKLNQPLENRRVH